MFNKVIHNYAHTLKLVPDWYKTQKMWDKTVDDYPSTIQFVPECYKTQERCNKALKTCFFLFDSVPSRYKTQKTCDEAVDDCLTALKLISDWFVTSKMYEKLHDFLLANDDIHIFDEDFSKVTLYATQIGILGVDLNEINFDDDNNFFEDDTDTITQFRLLACRNKLENCKIKS